MRVGIIEFRQRPDRAEIVQWAKNKSGQEYCYTLLTFEKDTEGFYARFVGDRPMQFENPTVLWGLMHYAQKVLDAAFKLQEDIK